MRTLNRIIFSFLLIAAFGGCQDDEPKLESLVVPTNLNVVTDVADDESGNVTVTATADDAITIHVIFKENADPVVVSPGEPASFQYIQSGQYEQNITVIAYAPGGISS